MFRLFFAEVDVEPAFEHRLGVEHHQRRHPVGLLLSRVGFHDDARLEKNGQIATRATSKVLCLKIGLRMVLTAHRRLGT